MSAIEMNKKLEEKKVVKETEVTFVSEYLKDNLKIKLVSLIYINSAGNYIEVFWEKDKQVEKQMVRTSLTKSEELLKKYKFIFKCHRSYIININRIDKIEGSSQGYKVFLKNIETPVHVSRNYTSELEELI
jgi:DNA-binding LytR/AlgR family response regulator